MNATATDRAPVTIGTPIATRGGLTGVVARIIEGDGRSATLGAGGFETIRQEYEIVWDNGMVSTVPDGIAQRDIEEARRRNLPTLSPEDTARALADVRAKLAEKLQRAEAEHAEDRRKREEFEADAKSKIPPGARAVIVGEHEVDNGDSMSDYYSTKTTRVVILAFSSHTRDLFPELRKAALNHPETAFLATAPDTAEHREKHSMGAGFYLKETHRYATGWTVRKRDLWNKDHPEKDIPTGEWSLATSAPAAVPATGALATSASGLRIERHVHTKHGFNMWIAILPDRVERAEFDRLLDRAKSLRGWYSKPWAGTPGGFAFKDEAAAFEFAGLAPDGTDCTSVDGVSLLPSTVAEDIKEAAGADRLVARTRQLDAAGKLLALADGLQHEIDDKLNPNRLSNTPKRQREAASARIEGRRLQRTQAALRALAELYDADKVPAVLAAVRTKAAVYDAMRAEIDRSNSGYYDAGIDTGKPASQTPVALALWALVGAPSEADAKAEELRRKIDALRFATIPGYFPTPAPIVAQMIDAAGIPENAPVAILEPEAGSGAIADILRDKFPAARLSVIERHSSLRDVLTMKGHQLVGADFLTTVPIRQFDFVLMNPPFENGQDIEHVQHAFAMLKPGGRLVAIMSPGPFFREDRRARDFRAWLANRTSTKARLPDGAFKESGTSVASFLVTIEADRA